MKIVNRFTGAVIFECDSTSWKVTVKMALESGANLSGANLSRADLSGANLSGANLSRADLSWANLSRADLSWADLSGANLSRADLSWANLSWADLSGANLSGADLSGADLFGEKITKPPLQIGCGMKWRITITEKHIQIGCQAHKAEEWLNFGDNEIASFHSEALPWWKENKDIIKALWEHHAKP